MQIPENGKRLLAAGVDDRPFEAGDALWLRVRVVTVLADGEWPDGCRVRMAARIPGLSHYCCVPVEDLSR